MRATRGITPYSCLFDISVGSEELQAMSSLKNCYSSYDQLNAVYLLTDELSKDLTELSMFQASEDLRV